MIIRKYTLMFFTVILLNSCASNSNQSTNFDVYRIHYQSILNNPVFNQAQSEFFNIEAYLYELSANQYRFDVFIDEPRVAMYDVEVLAIVDDGLLVVSEQMMPSLGIFESAEYNLIPFQVDASRGFYKGLNLNGVVNREPIQLKVLVIWKDYFRIRSFRDFIEFNLSTRDIPTVIEDEPEESEAEDSSDE
jgi:hypothetical protein